MTDKTPDAGITHYFTPEQEEMWEEFDRWSATQHEPISPRMAWQARAAHYSATFEKLNKIIGMQLTKLTANNETIARQNIELEALRIKANTAEKWKGIATAQDGDGRTVAQIEAPLKEQVAAAQADNVRLRNGFLRIRSESINAEHVAEEMLAPPLDTSQKEMP